MSRRSVSAVPPQSLARKAEEDRLVQRLLAGDLVHAQDNSGTERLTFMLLGKKQLKQANPNAPPGAEDMEASVGQQAGKLLMSTVELVEKSSLKEAVEREKIRRKVLDAMVKAMDAKKRFQERRNVGEGDREKVADAFYFAYEKLQEQQADIDKARRELAADRFEGNLNSIKLLLREAPPVEQEAQHLGDADTYERVQTMMENLLIRRVPNTDDETKQNSPAYLQLLKQKLVDARDHINELRIKVKELTAALKVASIESKSAQQLLAERNEDAARMKNTIAVLQRQLKNFNSRAAITSQVGAVGTAAGGGGTTLASKDEILRDYELLRQEYQDLADVNVMLERECKTLRNKVAYGQTARQLEGAAANASGSGPASFQPTYRTQKKSSKDKSSDNVNGPKGGASSANGSPRVQPSTSSASMMSLLEAKRVLQLKLEATEKAAMAAHDVNASAPKANPFGKQQPGGAHRGSFKAFQETQADKTAAAAAGRVGGNRSVGQSHSSATRRRQDDNVDIELPPPIQAVSAADSAKERLQKASDEAGFGKKHSSDGDSPDHDGGKGPCWVALCRKVVAAVAVSRADVLRREELHTKKQRHKIAFLATELSSTMSERDNLQDKLGRATVELADTKEQLSHAQSKLVAAVASGGIGGANAFGGLDDVWSRPTTAQYGNATTTSEKPPVDTSVDAVKWIRDTMQDRQRQRDETGTEAEPSDAQIESLIAVFNRKVEVLEREVKTKEQTIDELRQRLMAAPPSNGATPRDSQFLSAAHLHHHHGVGGSESPSEHQIRRLERDVIRKDQELLMREKELRMMDVRLGIAESQITEAKLAAELHLSPRAASRVALPLRLWTETAKTTVAVQAAQQPSPAADPSLQHPSAASSAATRAAIAALEERGTDADVDLLQAMLQLANGAEQRDVINNLILQAALVDEAADGHAAMDAEIAAAEVQLADQLSSSMRWAGPQGLHRGELAFSDKQWYLLRGMWLQLILARERAVVEAPTATDRRTAQQRLTDTYVAFFKFEGLDSNSDTRPAMCREAAMRAISFAAAPITSEASKVSGEDVEAEYVALKELVKSRKAQQLTLETERDEALSSANKLAAPSSLAKRVMGGATADSCILHRVDAAAASGSSASSVKEVTSGTSECASEVCLQYGITHPTLLRNTFSRIVSASWPVNAALPANSHGDALRLRHKDRLYVPISTSAALFSAADVPLSTIIVRHLLQPEDTVASIALLYGVAQKSVCAPYSLLPLDVVSALAVDFEYAGVCAVDVIVRASVAVPMLTTPPSDNPFIQPVTGVFAVLPSAVPVSAVCLAFATSEYDLALHNLPLEAGTTVSIPLIISDYLITKLPYLLSSQRLAVRQRATTDESAGRIAQRLKVDETRVITDLTKMTGGASGSTATAGGVDLDLSVIPMTTSPSVVSLFPASGAPLPAGSSLLGTTAAGSASPTTGGGLKPPKSPSGNKTSVFVVAQDLEDLALDPVSAAAFREAKETLALGSAAPSSPIRKASEAAKGAPTHTALLTRSRWRFARRGRVDDSDVLPSIASTRDEMVGPGSPLATADRRFLHLQPHPLAVAPMEHNINYPERLTAMAMRYRVLREHCHVPNFVFLQGVAIQWTVRLRSLRQIQIARDRGLQVHAVVPLLGDEAADLARTFNTTVEFLRMVNPEMTFNDREPLYGFIRVPLLNPKMFHELLKRSGEFYAVYNSSNNNAGGNGNSPPSSNTSTINNGGAGQVQGGQDALDNVTHLFGVDASDVGAFDVTLDPQLTPKVVIHSATAANRFINGMEYRLAATMQLDGVEWQSMTEEVTSRASVMVGQDVLAFASYVRSMPATDGIVTTVHVAAMRPGLLKIVLVATGPAILEMVVDALIEDASVANMEATFDYLKSKGAVKSGTSKLPITMLEHRVHSYGASSANCIVSSVHDADCLANIAIATGWGINSLLAYNPLLIKYFGEAQAATDDSPASLLGVVDLTSSQLRERRLTVQNGESLTAFCLRYGLSETPGIVEVKEANVDVLPIGLATRSIRIPDPVATSIEALPSTVTIRTTGDETLTSLATRLGVPLDSLLVNHVELPVGVQLKIPAAPGTVFSDAAATAAATQATMMKPLSTATAAPTASATQPQQKPIVAGVSSVGTSADSAMTSTVVQQSSSTASATLGAAAPSAAAGNATTTATSTGSTQAGSDKKADATSSSSQAAAPAKSRAASGGAQASSPAAKSTASGGTQAGEKPTVTPGSTQATSGARSTTTGGTQAAVAGKASSSGATQATPVGKSSASGGTQASSPTASKSLTSGSTQAGGPSSPTNGRKVNSGSNLIAIANDELASSKTQPPLLLRVTVTASPQPQPQQDAAVATAASPHIFHPVTIPPAGYIPPQPFGAQHVTEGTDTEEVVAERYGITAAELRLANAAVVRVPKDTVVTVIGLAPGAVTSSASSAATAAGSQHSLPSTYVHHTGQARPGSAPSVTRVYYARHIVQPNDTLPSIAAQYVQPISAILNLNPKLGEAKGAHCVLVPIVSSDAANSLLLLNSSNTYVIVRLAAGDTIGSVAQRFGVPAEKVADATDMLQDAKLLVVPLMSASAATIARQRGLQIFCGTSLSGADTMSTIADRYGVAVKDLMVLGKKLLPMGITAVNVPVNYQMAKTLIAATASKVTTTTGAAATAAGVAGGPGSPKQPPMMTKGGGRNTPPAAAQVFFRGDMLPTDNLQQVATDLGTHVTKIVPDTNSTTIFDVPLESVEQLDKAKTREHRRAQQRNELVQKTTVINQALRELMARNEATQRELEKVEFIRDQHHQISATISQQRQALASFNTASVGVQAGTGVVDDMGNDNGHGRGATTGGLWGDGQGSTTMALAPAGIPTTAPRRNGATQTKLMHDHLSQIEESAARASTAMRLSEAKAEEANHEKVVLAAKLADVEGRLSLLQKQIDEIMVSTADKDDLIRRLELHKRNQRAAADAAGSIVVVTRPAPTKTMTAASSSASLVATASSASLTSAPAVETQSVSAGSPLHPHDAAQQTTPDVMSSAGVQTLTPTPPASGPGPAGTGSRKSFDDAAATAQPVRPVIPMDHRSTQTSPVVDFFGGGGAAASATSPRNANLAPGTIPGRKTHDAQASIAAAKEKVLAATIRTAGGSALGQSSTTPSASPLSPPHSGHLPTPRLDFVKPMGSIHTASTLSSPDKAMLPPSTTRDDEAPSTQLIESLQEQLGVVEGEKAKLQESLAIASTLLREGTTDLRSNLDDLRLELRGSLTNLFAQLRSGLLAAADKGTSMVGKSQQQTHALEEQLRKMQQQMSAQATVTSKVVLGGSAAVSKPQTSASLAASKHSDPKTKAAVPGSGEGGTVMSPVAAASPVLPPKSEEQIIDAIVDSVRCGSTDSLAKTDGDLEDHAWASRRLSHMLVEVIASQHGVTPAAMSQAAGVTAPPPVTTAVAPPVPATVLDGILKPRQPTPPAVTGGLPPIASPRVAGGVDQPMRANAMLKALNGSDEAAPAAAGGPPSSFLSLVASDTAGGPGPRPPAHGQPPPGRRKSDVSERRGSKGAAAQPAAETAAAPVDTLANIRRDLSQLVSAVRSDVTAPGVADPTPAGGAAAASAQRPPAAPWGTHTTWEPKRPLPGPKSINGADEDVHPPVPQLPPPAKRSGEPAHEPAAADVAAPPPPLVPARLEELIPVVAIIDQLNTNRMSEEQHKQVDAIRHEDDKLRREQAALQYKKLNAQLRMRKLLESIDLAGSKTEKEALMKVAVLWRKWLDKWNTRRRQIIQERRENITRLLHIFFSRDSDSPSQDEDGEGGEGGSPSARGPRGAGIFPWSVQSRGILVHRPHKPGSKLQAMTLPVTQDAPSSSHFSAARI